MPILTTKNSGQLEVLAARFQNLTEEVNALKLVFSTILAMRETLCLYPGCTRLVDSFEEQKGMVKERLASIETFLKNIDGEMKKLKTFIKETPKGIQ